jgi:CRISPR system Cascade subunit CasA
MPLNLIRDRWIPVVHASGARSTIAPHELTLDLDGDPVTAPDWPRGDLNIAQLEWLIGLLFAAMPPDAEDDGESWLKVWHNPPEPDVLKAAFEPLMPAFHVDGDGPRFLQDYDADLPGEGGTLDALFIDGAGSQTVKRNADHMVKRDRYPALSRASAAMALYAMQAFAPSGGKGNRTSMRGGGPMTSLVLPVRSGETASPTLFHWLWANTPGGAPLAAEDFPRAFAWLAPTRTSEKGEEVHETEAHPVQAFFGMPRRVRLSFTEGEGVCALTGARDTVMVTATRQRPYGVNYGVWRHPLTPYRPQKKGEALPLHPRAGRFTIRDWVSVAVTTGEAGVAIQPAQVVTRFLDTHAANLSRSGEAARLVVAGWAMDNMKPLDFLETERPLFAAASPQAQIALDTLARRMADAAGEVANALHIAVRSAFFPENAAHDAATLTTLKERCFAEIKDDFYALLSARAAGDSDNDTAAREFLRTMQDTARRLFDSVGEPPVDPEKAKRVVDARKQLELDITGYGTRGRGMFATLGLTPPPQKARSGKKEAA